LIGFPYTRSHSATMPVPSLVRMCRLFSNDAHRTNGGVPSSHTTGVEAGAAMPRGGRDIDLRSPAQHTAQLQHSVQHFVQSVSHSHSALMPSSRICLVTCLSMPLQQATAMHLTKQQGTVSETRNGRATSCSAAYEFPKPTNRTVSRSLPENQQQSDRAVY
jgi:hypothetical protein